MKKLVALAVFAALAACGLFAWHYYPVWNAKQLVKSEMYDPTTVLFDHVEVIDGAVCGQVNAKNQNGAYVGFRGFVVDGSTVLIAPSEYFDDSTVGKSLEEIREQLKAAEARLALLKRMQSLCPMYGGAESPKRTDYEVKNYEGEVGAAEVLRRSGAECAGLYTFRHKSVSDLVLIICRAANGAETEWLWRRGEKTADGPLDLKS